MSDNKPSTSKPTLKKSSDDEEEDEDSTMEAIRKFFIQKFNIKGEESGPTTKVIENLTLDGLIKHWNEKGFKNVITMVGAGISTSAGIPDFRSPGSGLYDNLEKFHLPYPSAVFEMDYFVDNPQPFFALAKELYPGTFMPTLSHYFVRMLHEKGLLLRHYSQNIDTLERIAGIPEDKLVEAHGTFFTNHCLDCRKLYSMGWMKEQIFADHVPTCEKCNGVVKPDIIFFGENLPERFYKLPDSDFAKCDLLIIMGTSLEVQPFASLVDRPGPNCLRLLINRTKVGQETDKFSSFIGLAPKMKYDCDKNTRDVAYIGDCDDGVLALAEGIGWGAELKKLVKEEHARLTKESEVLSKTEKDLKNDAKRLDEQDSGAVAAAKTEKQRTEPKL